MLCETQSSSLCLDSFELRCKSLRLVVITVLFYYANILSGAGCLAFRGITLRLEAFFRPYSVIDVYAFLSK